MPAQLFHKLFSRRLPTTREPMSASPRCLRSSARQKRRAFERRKRNALRVAAVSIAVVGVLASLVLSGVFVNKALHQHVHLTIILNGQPEAVPGGIGITAALWNDHSLD